MSREIDLVLVRHGQAGSAASDEHRALTGWGRRHVREVGALLASQETAIDTIITSPLVRAVQTAEILAAALGLDEDLEVRSEIAFPARLEQVLAVVDEAPAPTRGVMVVGHEPTMGMLAQQLIGDDGPRIGFRTGTALALRWTRGSGSAAPRYALVGQPPARTDLGA